jgi:hypothetical protein
MMAKPLPETLAAFEGALATPSPDYDALIAAFRDLVVPADVTDADLTRLYRVCYRLLDIPEGGPPADLRSGMSEWRAGHLTACAGGEIERTLYDPQASTRAWIARSRERFRERGQPIPDEVSDDNLPPRLSIPWDAPTATVRIRPFLTRFETSLRDAPAAHFRLCWNVARDGYPVFQEVITGWLADLDARGLGWPRTAEAIATARDLLALSNAAEPMPWAECEGDLLPLLAHPHPMVAAGAARWLGALYGSDGLDGDPDAPSLTAMLERLRTHPKHRIAVAGGFVCGYDIMLDGLSALAANKALKATGFDVDQWVLDVLTFEKDTAYLPNAQGLWLYVHEHYAADPAFVGRLIGRDRAWIAMMCATELDEAVEGMRPVLERLAADLDPEIAHPASVHLDRYY